MIDVSKKRIAIIGGAGFIGHNLALALKKKGAIVDIIDSLQVNNLLHFTSNTYQGEHRELYSKILNQRFDLLRHEGVPLEIQDARDYHALSHLLNKVDPQIIIHLAAVAHADRSNKDPYSTFDHSLRTLENALDWARGKVEHFIFFSSSMIYGNFESGSVSEETVCNPLGIYGALKLAGEKIVIAYNQVFDLPYTIIRPSALYGERCVSRRVAQIFVENALQGKVVTISGDGNDSLDFTYIGDLVQGVERVLENENSKNQVFNITFGKARSIKELSEIIIKHFPDVKINYIPKNKLMPERGTLCTDKARSMIGYDPQFPLEKGIMQYINWYKSLT